MQALKPQKIIQDSFENAYERGKKVTQEIAEDIGETFDPSDLFAQILGIDLGPKGEKLSSQEKKIKQNFTALDSEKLRKAQESGNQKAVQELFQKGAKKQQEQSTYHQRVQQEGAQAVSEMKQEQQEKRQEEQQKEYDKKQEKNAKNFTPLPLAEGKQKGVLGQARRKAKVDTMEDKPNSSKQ